MRSNAHTTQESKSLRLVVLFVVFLLVFVGVSLVIKAISLIKVSTFDGAHRFTIYASADNKEVRLLSLEPKNTSVLLTVKGEKSEKAVSSLLSLPIDAMVTLSNNFPGNASLPTLLGQLLFSPRAHLSGFTRFDLLRLYALSLWSSRDSVTEEVSLRKGIPEDYSEKKYFIDHGIVEEDKTIGVINSTAASGIGQRLEDALTLLGGNVVSVTTGREEQEPTYIYFSGKKSYTVQRLERLFNQKAEEGNTQASDILVVIGKRSLSLPLFGTL